MDDNQSTNSEKSSFSSLPSIASDTPSCCFEFHYPTIFHQQEQQQSNNIYSTVVANNNNSPLKQTNNWKEINQSTSTTNNNTDSSGLFLYPPPIAIAVIPNSNTTSNSNNSANTTTTNHVTPSSNNSNGNPNTFFDDNISTISTKTNYSSSSNLSLPSCLPPHHYRPTTNPSSNNNNNALPSSNTFYAPNNNVPNITISSTPIYHQHFPTINNHHQLNRLHPLSSLPQSYLSNIEQFNSLSEDNNIKASSSPSMLPPSVCFYPIPQSLPSIPFTVVSQSEDDSSTTTTTSTSISTTTTTTNIIPSGSGGTTTTGSGTTVGFRAYQQKLDKALHKTRNSKIEKKRRMNKKESSTVHVNNSNIKPTCFICKENVDLMPFHCECGHVFCLDHRLPEEHTCTFDWKAKGRKELKKSLPKVVAEKVRKI
ncbi:hypothetical protein ABK040_015648 [Willaertia magna]